jgi:hypothetical protein
MAVMTATLARVFERKEENNARICAKRDARRSLLFLVSLNTGPSPCYRRPLSNNQTIRGWNDRQGGGADACQGAYRAVNHDQPARPQRWPP